MEAELLKKIKKEESKIKRGQTCMGKHNAQIESLRTEMKPFQSQIDEIQKSVDEIQSKINLFQTKNVNLEANQLIYHNNIRALKHQLSLLELATENDDVEFLYNKWLDRDDKEILQDFSCKNYLCFDFTCLLQFVIMRSKYGHDTYDDRDSEWEYMSDDYESCLESLEKIRNQMPPWTKKLSDQYIRSKHAEYVGDAFPRGRINDHVYDHVSEYENYCDKENQHDIWHGDWDDDWNNYVYHLKVPFSLYVLVPPADLEQFGITKKDVVDYKVVS